MNRVAVYPGAGRPITLECVPDPQPARNEVLIRIARCGLCGSDLSLTSGSAFDYPDGCRLGHEFSGEVVDLGGPDTGYRRGDRVTCIPQLGCGRCSACKVGRPIFCPTAAFVSGGFGDYLAAPASSLIRLPRSVGFAEGALIEPMACGLRALRRARMAPGAELLVLGGGSIALSLVYWGRRLGAGKIVAASRSARGGEVLMALGADAVHSFERDDPHELAGLFESGAPNLVAECVGKPGLMAKAVELVRPGGTVVSLGMCLHPEPISPALCAFKEIDLLFSLAYSVDEFLETTRAFDTDAIRPDIMVSQVIGLDGLIVAFGEARAGRGRALKLHVDPALG